MICPTYLFAKQFAMNSNRDAYFYMLTYQSNIFGSLNWDDHGDVVHGADMAFVFGHPLRDPKSYTETDYDFSIDVMQMWTNFATNGKPHHEWSNLLDRDSDNLVSNVKDLNPDQRSRFHPG
ncbi:unnamed protein product [Oppiella nova]|uniref:Carboxylesterase type B domain-containing protein n=1 Tax=Oppiella nova TaxID=334625 RepID=A0A7R9MLA5_9ACAR|nr:unnamed protein product [Oppiella nova]CAG2179507.1 unnamed protein product [Oppiella nova]